ncbi:porphobilinogen deaminase [Coemansia sp. RSA 1813]|nr:porphobilinogen deaminase [Coemansia sp. RSA 1646]KAJ1771801.1 porphobilinogen deaminase [Coemansia sp. RSA 1843]KAJ2090766.1 porphobilinogen deaminase [Coemansia sp. RSA 986]KAJ2216014.1 porphobilinogen deaminase [Coemansia sp. RSA 487]KAJ2570428.1 porphobilinogen deaminase [Coemansia sp. RSA 1813]
MPVINKTTPASTQQQLRVGTRGSQLALIQTEYVVGQLKKQNPALTVHVETIKTIGDKIQDVAMSKIGDKGLFTKELEAALESKAIDLVVHSLKDMPTLLPEDMELAAITEREDPRDAVIMSVKNREVKQLGELPEGSVVGTGSVRRVAQLRRLYPHLQFMDIRGNLDTRMAKLDAEGSPYAALVLAAAGMQRVGAQGRITHKLDNVLYAVGQGALGIEARAADAGTKQFVAQCLSHRRTRLACLAERQLMRDLEGGCSVPIGVRTQWDSDYRRLVLQAIVVSPDGAEAVEAEADASFAPGSSSSEDACAQDLGARVAATMRERGASKILDAIHTPPQN